MMNIKKMPCVNREVHISNLPFPCLVPSYPVLAQFRCLASSVGIVHFPQPRSSAQHLQSLSLHVRVSVVEK